MSTSKETAMTGAGADVPVFRLDNERLAFRFTATLSDRYGTPVERLPTAERLDAWLRANGLQMSGTGATEQDHQVALSLREAIHRAGTAVAQGTAIAVDDLAIVNAAAREHVAFPELVPAGLRWIPSDGETVRSALGLVARDAIVVLGGEDRPRVKTCQNPDCRGLYVDTSQAGSRRWCSMNVCGNRAKKAKFRHGRTSL
ncbi:ABATE domain-containing protein [Actinomycetaceae bacterium L2_0104]